jgi:Protein of unknown function (DUF4435)
MSLSALKGPGEVVAEAIMTRMGFAGTLLIVEGPDDSRFFRARIDNDACDLIIAGGKLAVVGGIDRLDAQHFRGALGVCDDDCASLDGHRPASPNLIVTEWRDLDTLLVRSPALERVLAEYGDTDAIQKFEGTRGSVRDNLTRLALPYGRLRWLSTREHLGIDFEKLKPVRFINPDWSLKADDLMTVAADQLKVAPKDLEARVTALPAVDPWLACQGHDLLAILALGLGKGGALGSRNPGRDHIASMLRASLDSAHWVTSHLANEIRRWEGANPPFKVLLNS